MIDAIPGTMGVIVFCIAILILTGIAFLIGLISMSLVVAVLLFIAFTLFVAVLGFFLNPRPRKDHYEIPFGDYPKVPHGR